MVQPQRHYGGTQTATVILLPLGALIMPLAWLVGVVMLCSGRVWSVGEKLIGTVLTAVGFLWIPVLVIFSSHTICATRTTATGRVIEHCSGKASSEEEALLWSLFALVVLTPILTALFLRRQGMRRSAIGV